MRLLNSSRGIFALLLTGLAVRAADDWPQFRGPSGDGHSDSTGLPVVLSETAALKWKTPIPGKGWSSPVILGNQVWVSTATEDGTELSVLCLDKDTGQILQNRVLFHVQSPQACHKFNSYASPTPVLEAGRLYVTFGSPGTACLDTQTGEVLWQRTDFVCNHYRGAGSSPVLWHDLLLMHFDGSDAQFVVALDKNTGKTVWKVNRSVDYRDLQPDGTPIGEGDYRKAFSTPQVYGQAGADIVLSSGGKAHYGYDAATGRELWRFEDRDGHSASTRPVVSGGMAYFPTGFGRASLVALKLGGTGLLSEADVAWRLKKAVPNKPSVLLSGELLFALSDGGILSCLEAATGNVLWTQRVQGNYSASPLLAEGRIYVCSEEGKVAVIAAAREFSLLQENQLPGGFMASPAVSGHALFLRSKTHLYRFEN